MQLGGMTPVRNGKNAENRTLRNSSSTNQTVLATKKFRMTKSQENAVLNLISENSCLPAPFGIRGYSLHFFFVSWWLCGYEVIMQNKPNLLDTQMNVSYCFNKGL